MTALDFYKERLKDKGFSDKQVKDLTEHKDLPWIQFAENYHAKQLILSGVSNRRELLIATLYGWQDYKDQGISIEDYLDEIESNL